jgi:photosynthetic reaction center cytochrome c subunit
MAGGLIMRTFLLWLLASVSLVAQQPAARGGGPAPTYKNLKVLAPNSDIPFIMTFFNEALGVQCTYCHVQGDLAADGNPKKEMARKMISMVRVIDTSFPSSNGVFPAGYHEVDCLTCHRGSVKPETVATAQTRSVTGRSRRGPASA